MTVLPVQNNNMLGKNIRVLGKITGERLTSVLTTLLPSAPDVCGASTSDKQQLLFHILGVTAHTKLPMPADQNTMSVLLEHVLDMARDEAVAARAAPVTAGIMTDTNTVDWTTRIGSFLLLPGSSAGQSSPVLKDTATGIFYRAPAHVTETNLHTYKLVANWSAKTALLRNNVHEVLCQTYVSHATPVTMPEPIAATPRARSAVMSPLSAEKVDAPRRRPLPRRVMKRNQA